MAHGNLTLVVVTRHRIVRADVSRDGASAAIASAVRPPEHALPVAVEAAIGLSATKPGTTWVLSDEVIAQTMSLASGAVRGLDTAALDRALALEAQTLSGDPASASALAWAPAGEDGASRRFHVTQVPTRERDEIDDAVRRAGGRLAGILHPAGVPAPLPVDDVALGRWRRVELWPDLVATVEAEATSGVRARLARSDPNRWRDPDAASRVPPSALVACDLRTQPSAFTDRVAALEDAEVLTAWIAAWAVALAAGAAGVAAVSPRRRPLSVPAKAALASAVVLVVLVAAALHYRALGARRDALRSETALAAVPAAEIDRVRARTKVLEDELKKSRAAASVVQSDAELRTRLREHPARVLRAIAATCPEAAVVDGLELGAEKSWVRGSCAVPEAADQFAAGLTRHLATFGYRVAAPVRRRIGKDGERARFEYELEIAAPALPAPAAPLYEERP